MSVAGAAEGVVAELAAGYEATTGIAPHIFVTRAAAGASEIAA